MYIRPRSLYEKFLVAERINRIDADGRQKNEFKLTGEVIFGVLSIERAYESEKYSGVKHITDGTIVQRGGNLRASVGDLLIKGTRKFLVKAVETPAGMEFWQVYHVQERFDI